MLLYGSCMWILTKELEKKLDGCYTKMLRVVKNVSWKQHMRKEVFHGEIPKITTAIAAQRKRLSGHCYYYGNQHMAKELVGDQDKHSLINWLMTANYRKKISQMQ